MRSRVLLVLGLSVTVASASPPPKPLLAATTVEALNGQAYPLLSGKGAVLLFYEDEDAGKQNERLKERLGRLLDRAGGRERLIVMPIADVQKWNWWPARKYVRAELRQVEAREHVRLFCDWRGDVRRALGLTRGKSGVVLLGEQGEIEFWANGPLGAAQQAELFAHLAALGVPTAEP